MMRVTPFNFEESALFVISHEKITERKLAEEKVLNLSRLDGLTNISNRRNFDEFINQEWQRCSRLKMPLSIAIIDLDHFKLLNDTYGHQQGDACLKKIGKLLKNHIKRPSDLCARYGGEEFAIVMGNTTSDEAYNLLSKILVNIKELKIKNENSPTLPILTASIGLATLIPEKDLLYAELIKMADKALYLAKENGRNQVALKR